MKLTRTIIATVAFLAGCAVVAGGLFLLGAHIQRASLNNIKAAEIYISVAESSAKATVEAAKYSVEAARQNAIQAHIELESKRTTVQREIREIVIAEWKKCKKGKC